MSRTAEGPPAGWPKGCAHGPQCHWPPCAACKGTGAEGGYFRDGGPAAGACGKCGGQGCRALEAAAKGREAQARMRAGRDR